MRTPVSALAPLALVAGLAFSPSAQAVEVGTSLALGVGSFFGSGLGDLGTRAFPPTLDLRFEPLHLQIHVLEFLDQLVEDGELFLGANLYYQVYDAPIAGEWSGVVQPGISLDLATANDLFIALAVESRFGIQAASSAGFGLYAVPSLGFATVGGNSAMVAGGTLQMSVWFGG